MKKRLLITWYHILSGCCILGAIICLFTFPVWFFVWLFTGYNIVGSIIEAIHYIDEKLQYIR